MLGNAYVKYGKRSFQGKVNYSKMKDFLVFTHLNGATDEALLYNRFDSISVPMTFVGRVLVGGDEYCVFENDIGYFATRYIGSQFAIDAFLKEVLA